MSVINSNFEQISDAIRFHRKKAGLSRNDLAKISGVGKATLFDIEHGKNSVRLTSLLKVLSALNISLMWDSPLRYLYEEKQSDDNKAKT
jgi:HTH-type transcriptional regulator/antitoxin HipB